MRFPRRPVKSIQAIPSIHTAFRADPDRHSDTPTNGSPESSIEEGLEVVPIERSNSTCGKIVSPGTEEKELASKSPLEIYIAQKPLPSLPPKRRRPISGRSWKQLPAKQRIFVLVFIQVGLVLTLFAGLMSIKGSPLNRQQNSSVQTSDVNDPSQSSPPITEGTYSIALGNARQQSSGCLAANNESVAWVCTDGRSLQIDITISSTNRLVSLMPLGNSSRSMYGQQSPEIAPTELHPASDADVTGHKPLYSFKTVYNSTVLLPTAQLRHVGDPSVPPVDVAGTVVQPKDSPWLCFFNDTIIEGFIYAPENSTLAPANESDTSQIPQFPYIIRLSEQRFPNGTQPYCERRTVSENGELIPNGTDKQYLASSEPAFLLNTANRNTVRSSGHRRQQMPMTNSCQCEWFCKHSNW